MINIKCAPSLSPFFLSITFINSHLIVIAVFWPRSETKPLPYSAKRDLYSATAEYSAKLPNIRHTPNK